MRLFRYPRTSPIAALILLTLAGSARGEEGAPAAAEQRAVHLERMKALAGSMEIYAAPQNKESAVALIPQPVLRYADNTRENYESALWIWSGGRRPTAIAAIEFYPNKDRRGPRWLYEVASLSDEPIAARRGPDLNWTAKAGLGMRPLDATEPPADKATRRLAQMKALHRRFAAHEVTPIEGRIELTPLASPLYRYADADAGILDGVLFAFTNGTNPEVLLLLEARGDAEKAAWHFGLAQMTGAEVVVELGAKTIWNRSEADPPAARESYVNGWISEEKPE